MKWLNTKVTLPIATLVTGVIWIYLGITKYGFWTNKGPGGGFFPTMVGALLIVVSIIAAAQGLKEKVVKYQITTFLPIIACMGILLMAQIFGMIISIFIYLISWLKLYEKYSWKVTLVVSISVMAVIYGAFVVWLKIPFPRGLIYNNYIQ